MSRRKRKSSTKVERDVHVIPAIVRLAADITVVEKQIGQNATENVEIQMQMSKLHKRINDNVEHGRQLRHQLANLHRDMDKHTASSR